jgi:predicted DsbA family dithiol-disulfide isomerase
MSTNPTVKVDIWSDVFCPYCFIGKRRLFRVAQEHGYDLEVVWHSFELNPSAPTADTEGLVTLISKKYGLSQEKSIQAQQNLAATATTEGIDFQWQKARPSNSFDAHRLIQFASTKNLANEAEEQLFKAYMTEGKLISDKNVLIEIATTIGLDATEVSQMLDSDQFESIVRQDELIARHLQISGVPFFIFNDRLSVSGAQPDSVFKNALWQASTEYPLQTKPAAVKGQNGDLTCTDESCAI